MAEKVNDLLLGEAPIVLEGKHLCVKAERDGYTGTHQGNYWYAIAKSLEGDYTVTPQKYDVETKGFVAGDDPIILTKDDVIYYVVGTNLDSYTFPILAEADIEVGKIEKQVLQAFKAYASDKFRFGNYNLFLEGDQELVTP